MIEGVVGFPGAGKTYYALNRAKTELKRGRPVYANFDIDGTKRITPETMFQIEPGAFVILDEAQNWFGSRNWSRFGDEYMTFFSQTRKKAYTLLWISQDVSSVDKMIRDRTHMIHEMTSWLGGFFGHPLFFTVKSYYGAKNLGKQSHHAMSTIIWFKKDVANSYDTHEIIEARKLPTENVRNK